MHSQKKIRVWDILVRCFHWSLVLSFTIAYLTGEEETQLHDLSGYIILGLISFRVIWGVIGSQYARFANFVYSPARTLSYARSWLERKPVRYLGHNPLGGWMIIVLLLSLSLTIWTGLELEASVGRGPLATKLQVIQTAVADEDHEHEEIRHAEADKEGDKFWEELHEVIANLTLMLVMLHIAGVIFTSFTHRENLVKSMITGFKFKDVD